MDPSNSLHVSVSEFIALTNQTLEFAYPSVAVEGEVASFKVNQNKYVFFDLKDATGTVGCFMTVYQLRMPIEDGMRIVVTATPKLTQWGRFSLTVRSLRPLGDGSLKKSFELLKKRLGDEGLFALDRKRALPELPHRIGVISSTQAAGYADFIKILDERWGGVTLEVAHVQVQGAAAADQIIRALQHFNQQAEPPDVLVLIRGGGSADDLAVFNDEPLVRAVVASRVPVLTGIGHEVDQSLVDLAADYAASTPSNAAQVVVPDRREVAGRVRGSREQIRLRLKTHFDELSRDVRRQLENLNTIIVQRFDRFEDGLARKRAVLAAFDPRAVLARGYAIVRGKVAIGEQLTIETKHYNITAEVQHVEQR